MVRVTSGDMFEVVGICLVLYIGVAAVWRQDLGAADLLLPRAGW
jgi:hypothetical protein